MPRNMVYYLVLVEGSTSNFTDVLAWPAAISLAYDVWAVIGEVIKTLPDSEIGLGIKYVASLGKIEHS